MSILRIGVEGKIRLPNSFIVKRKSDFLGQTELEQITAFFFPYNNFYDEIKNRT